MHKVLLIKCISYLLIFILSSGMPIYIFIKTRCIRWLSVLISLVLSVGGINIFFHIWSTLHLPPTLYFNELHETFWIIPPLFVYCYCLYLEKSGIRNK